MDSHPVYSLIVSPNILNELVCDFEREINSKRQQSKISSIGDLIVVLYKRNVVDRSNFNDILDNVLNRFPSTGDKGKIKDFINLLDRRIDCHNANKNQYGEFGSNEMSTKNFIHFEFTLIYSRAETSQFKTECNSCTETDPCDWCCNQF